MTEKMRQQQQNHATTIEEEIDCMKNIEESLTASLKTITHFADLLYQERNLLKEEYEDAVDEYKNILQLSRTKFNDKFKSTIQPCIDEALECFQLAVTLLGSDPDPLRIQMVVFDNTPEFVATLLAFVAVPIPFRSSSDFNVSILTQKNEGIFLNLKVYALKTLTKFISICSYEAANMYEDEEEASKRIAKECAECVVEGQGLEVLLNFLEIDETESVRVAIAEALFFFIVRNEMGRLAVVIQRGISTFMNCLEVETSAIIRSYYCAILREIGTVYPEELLKENMIGTASKLLNIDPSPDVRALCAEILEVLFRNDTNSMKYLEESKIDLPKILSDRLMQDQTREVLEAICKLLETMFGLKNKTFLNKFISIGGWRSFIRVLKSCSVRPASLAVRGLRYLLQNSDYQLALGKAIITHFPSLSAMLKAALEQDEKEHKKHTVAHKLLKVELAICMGLIFAQNPACRLHVYNELKAFPVWMSSLRSSLLKNLSLAEMEYFANINLIDFSGTNLVTSFSSDSSDVAALKRLFMDQEFRYEQVVNDGYFEQEQRRDDVFAFDASDEISWGKIKSSILSYAVHLTLCPPEQPLQQASNDIAEPVPESLYQEPDYYQEDVHPVHVLHQQQHQSYQQQPYQPPFVQSTPVKATVQHQQQPQQQQQFESMQQPRYPPQQTQHQFQPTDTRPLSVQERVYSGNTPFSHSPRTVYQDEGYDIEDFSHQSNVSPSPVSLYTRQQREMSPRAASLSRPVSAPFEYQITKPDKPQRPRRQATDEIIYINAPEGSTVYVTEVFRPDAYEPYPTYQTESPSGLRSDVENQDQYWYDQREYEAVEQAYPEQHVQQPYGDGQRFYENIESNQYHHETSIRQEPHPFDASEEYHFDFQNRELRSQSTNNSHLYVDDAQDFDTQSVHSREGSEFNLQPRKNRQVSTLPGYQHNPYGPNLSVQQPMHDPIELSQEEIARRKKKAVPKRSLRQIQLENALFLPKKFGVYYVDEKMLRRKEQSEKKFLENYRIANSSPSVKTLKNYVSTGDGLVRKQYPMPSPQKLQKSWTESDVKEGDLFVFEIPFDDFRLPLMEQIVARIKKHHKLVKKFFITCPQGSNAKGRRTFLLDMNLNIIPRIQLTVQELVKLVKEHGEERIKLPIYLWKGRERQDRSVTNRNVLEILEYIKMYLANHGTEESKIQEAENNFAQQIESEIHKEDEQLKEAEEQRAVQVIRRMTTPQSPALRIPTPKSAKRLAPDHYPEAVVAKPHYEPRNLRKKVVSDNLYGILSDEQRMEGGEDSATNNRPFEADIEDAPPQIADVRPVEDTNPSPNEHVVLEY